MPRGSFPYVVLSTVLTLMMSSFLWGLFDYELVNRFTSTSIWTNGIPSAMLARHWIILAWDAFLPVVVLGCGIQLLIAARLNATSGGLIKRTFFLWVFDLFLVIWGLVFPNIIGRLFEVTQRNDVNNALTSTDILPAVTFLRDITFGYGPALLMVAAGLFYFWAPIRNDILRLGGAA